MSEMRYKTGEEPRNGDVVRLLNVEQCALVVAVGRTTAVLDRDGYEWGAAIDCCSLLRRAGEKEDRDREKYEYLDGAPPDFCGGWEMIVKEPPLVFRRLRQPVCRVDSDGDGDCGRPGCPACFPENQPPAKPPFDPAFAPPGFIAKPSGHGLACPGCHFANKAATGEECPPRCMAINRPDGQDVIFVKAEPAKPKFEALVLRVEDKGETFLYVLFGPDSPRVAAVGQGKDGFYIAGFFQDQASAEAFADLYRVEGKALCGHWEVPMITGNPAKFCVATRRNDETRS